MNLNPNAEVICCVSCGRDTTAKHGYCARCYRNEHDFHRRRHHPQRSLRLLSAWRNPLVGYQRDLKFHGQTLRDDV